VARNLEGGLSGPICDSNAIGKLETKAHIQTARQSKPASSGLATICLGREIIFTYTDAFAIIPICSDLQSFIV
jgi:hypothetical protein